MTERFSIGTIEDGPRDPWIEQQKEKLDAFILASPELQASIQALHHSALTIDVFTTIINDWNNEHRDWVGVSVERTYTSDTGFFLMIRMDAAGNVRLKGHVVPS